MWSLAKWWSAKWRESLRLAHSPIARCWKTRKRIALPRGLLAKAERVGVGGRWKSGEFRVKLIQPNQLVDELARLQVAELLVDDAFRLPEYFPKIPISRLNAWQFAPDTAFKLLTDYFACQDLRGFGLDVQAHSAAISAAGRC